MSTIPLREELGRGRYGIILVKKFPQREEHIASLSWKYTKMNPQIFKFIHYFETIPQSLTEIVRIIDLKGAKYDGKVEGEYSLVLRPRGEGHGNYMGGCDLYYNRFKIRISRRHDEDKSYCNDSYFLALLSTKDRTNMWLKNRFGERR